MGATLPEDTSREGCRVEGLIILECDSVRRRLQNSDTLVINLRKCGRPFCSVQKEIAAHTFSQFCQHREMFDEILRMVIGMMIIVLN